MTGSNRKNLAKQIGQTIPTTAPMTLHATTVAPLTDALCFTCQRPIKAGQRVRWCEVVVFVPAGFIHAQHFDSGPLFDKGRAPTRPPRPQRPIRTCAHRWTDWHRAGVFDTTEIRTCRYCAAVRTRPGRQTAPAVTASTAPDLPRRRSTLPVTKREAKRQASIRAARAETPNRRSTLVLTKRESTAAHRPAPLTIHRDAAGLPYFTPQAESPK
jgi:hypothetical protein